MAIRDATPDDAEALAGVDELSAPAVRRMIRERAVRVATAGDGAGDPIGYVSFDASRDDVEITRLGGDPTVFGDLLAEPIGFARETGLPVTAVVPESERTVRTALETAGLEAVGAGPRFEGRQTIRYRRSARDGPSGTT